METETDLFRAKLKAVASGVNTGLKYDLAVLDAQDSGSLIRHWVPTDSVLLNLLLGEENYGLAIGRVFELFGEFSNGKTTIAQILMSAVQRYKGISALADAESSWLESYAVKHGHDPSRHIFLEADTVEAGFLGVKETCRQVISVFGGEVVTLFVWDTIAASPTEKEAADDNDRMAAKAGVIRQQLRVLSKLLPKVPASVVFVNQTIDSFSQYKKKTTPGGGGIKFWSSQRLQVTKVGAIHDANKKVIGFISRVKAVKNKLGPPQKEVDIPILYESGVDKRREVLNYLIDNTAIVNNAGAYKKIVDYPEPGQYVSFYEKDMDKTFEDFPDLYEFLVEKTKQHWLGLL